MNITMSGPVSKGKGYMPQKIINKMKNENKTKMYTLIKMDKMIKSCQRIIF
jgi:hypothetical protein